jgi:heme/copper-type cytochrome/quinol oxidase subunit 2
MQTDTVGYDSLEARPLPKWLTDQRDGLNTYQPEVLEMKEDRSLEISIALTGLFIFITVIFLTILILRKNKKNKK